MFFLFALYQWLSDRKKRAMQNKDLDVRRRVELIQDFTMPGVSTNIQVTKDGKYILPWETVEQPPGAFTNFKYFFTKDYIF